MTRSLKQDAINWITEYQSRLIELSDRIWRFAELGFLEVKSSKLLADELEVHGFSIERGVAEIPTAFVATYGSNRPIIGVLGEFDALHGLSQKVLSHKEPIEPGAPGHGCGHNIHGVSGLGAVLAVKEAIDQFNISGTIKFFGCPAEEVIHGKVWMVKAHVFDGIDAALSHHPGTMNVAKLASNLANNTVKFHFYGKTAHAAGSPDQGRSALDAVELMNIGVNYLREHITQDARIHYVIEDGGGQPNIVPGYARTWYYIRAPERDQVDQIYDWILDIAKGAAQMSRTTLKVEFIKGVHNLLPNKTLGELVTANMRIVGSPKYTDQELQFAEEISATIPLEEKRAALRKSRRPKWEELMNITIDRSISDAWDEGLVSPGSTDVSDVSWRVPTMEFSTATWVLGTPSHSWQAVTQSNMGLGHKALLFAAKVIATTSLDLLTTPSYIEKAWAEWKNTMKGRIFKSHVSDKPPLDIWSQ